MIIKGKKSIRDNKLISHQWKEPGQQNVHVTFSFGLPRGGSTGCQMLKHQKPVGKLLQLEPQVIFTSALCDLPTLPLGHVGSPHDISPKRDPHTAA